MIMAYNTQSWFLALCLLLLCCRQMSSDDSAYASSLLKFKESLSNVTMLDNWKEPVQNLCSWNGLVCSNDSTIQGLRLENMGLGGTINIDILSDLPLLNFSVMNNNFSGPFPNDINKLGKLRSLYLANNGFSGEIPNDAFSGMNLRKVVLNDNEFTGDIPTSLLKLTKLEDLELQDNQFEGRILDFWQKNLVVNFSNNKLEGSIPSTLSSNDPSSFYGNLNLCGQPLDPCKSKKSILQTALIVASAVGFMLAAIIILFIIYHRRSRQLKYEKSMEKYHMEEHNIKKGETYNKNEHGKLYFVRNGRDRFELDDLLKASAEMLGSGSFGSSYKALLLTGEVYVVRRFRQMSTVGKEEFYEHIRRLGRLSHRNLMPLVAMYYGKEERLLITDFVEYGSLASHLHGKRSPNQQNLDWPARLRIIKGVSRGLSYLYKELPTLTVPHGHLKSSNVLLDSTYEPLLSDYALAPVINKDHAQEFMVAYKSPESTQSNHVTRKTDVWSLGILILELVTGQFPANYLKQGKGTSADLAAWVNSVVRDEWTGELLDKGMNLTRNCEGQILRLLKIGMCCCEWNVDRRWDLKEAVEKIEELKERDSDEDYSSYASEEYNYSSIGMTDDEFLFSRA